MEDQQDTIIWTGSRDGYFSVKSCYAILLQQGNIAENQWPWKMIWKVKVPTEVTCFGWIANHGACLTHNKSTKKKVFVAQQMFSMRRFSRIY